MNRKELTKTFMMSQIVKNTFGFHVLMKNSQLRTILRYANGVHLSAIWENTALVQ